MGDIVTALDVILDHLAPLEAKRVLDIGCGRGAMAAPLRRAGAIWTGVDPFPAADQPDIIKAGAEALPLPDAAFDAAVYLNALHHVPVPVMAQGLAETARVLGPAGRVVVIEPLATGALSTVLAVVDDETAIRAAAEEALRAAVTSGLFRLVTTFTYARQETFADFDAFAERMIAVDVGRAPAIKDQRDALQAVFVKHARRSDTGFVLDQPMRADILEKA